MRIPPLSFRLEEAMPKKPFVSGLYRREEDQRYKAPRDIVQTINRAITERRLRQYKNRAKPTAQELAVTRRIQGERD
ncbi:hypothetical protein IT396_01115 [Candidatus Nomurabacteria bacterium]|nr:hypothetical protein [Candidatus Nomurabacteria bacterium]